SLSLLTTSNRVSMGRYVQEILLQVAKPVSHLSLVGWHFQRIEAAVTAYQKLCNALFSSLERMSSQNIKYSDTVRIVNYDYFVQTIGSRGISTLQRFVDQVRFGF